MTHWRSTSTRADSKFDEREIRAWVFVALCVVSPLAILVFFLSIYRLFQMVAS